MKIKNWLYISVGLNCVAICFFLWSPTQAPKTSSVIAVTNRVIQSATTSLPKKNVTDAPSQTDWIQALHDAGFSKQRIGEIAAADFESRWQQRMTDAQRRFNRGEIGDNALALLTLQHDAEEEKALRAVLGDEGFLKWDQENTLRNFDHANLNLSADESQSLYQLYKNLQREQHDSQVAQFEGRMDDADADRQTGLAQEKYNQQLKTLLGDDRYAAIQGDDNPDTGALRRQLLNLNASQTQVAAMLQAQQQWTDQSAKLQQQLQSGQLSSAAYDTQVNALDAARETAYQNALGADAYAEYQNNQDSRYRTLKQYQSAWGLSDSNVKSLYAQIQDYDNSVSNYENQAHATEAEGQAVDWAGVQAVMQQFSQQNQSNFQNSLGPQLFNKLTDEDVLGFDTQ